MLYAELHYESMLSCIQSDKPYERLSIASDGPRHRENQSDEPSVKCVGVGLFRCREMKLSHSVI